MTMTDIINPSAAAARENARHSSGRFGEQEHTAPELTLEEAKRRTVDALLASYFEGQPPGEIAPEEVRTLMLSAIDQHQDESPAVIVLDGNGDAVNSQGVEVIDLDYLGEWFDDGAGADEHVARATEDLDRLRAAGLDGCSAMYSLREYLGNELDPDWYDDDEHVLGGRYGDYVIDEGYGAGEVKVRDLVTGDVIGTYPTFTEAKAAAESA